MPSTRTPRLRRLALIGAILLAGCGEEGITLPEPPEGGPPTLSGDVQPILDRNCAFSGCHAPTIVEPEAKPMNLAEGSARASTVNVAALQLPSMDRIEPGQPDRSYLVHKIQGTHLSVGGSGAAMPQEGDLPPLSPGEIETIRDWIAEGARDD